MKFKKRQAVRTAAGLVLALAGTTVLTSPAWAVSHSGNQYCNGAKVTQLTTNAVAPGYGTFINNANTSQVYTFGFARGVRKTLGYQQSWWHVTASGFNATPFTGCY